MLPCLASQTFALAKLGTHMAVHLVFNFKLEKKACSSRVSRVSLKRKPSLVHRSLERIRPENDSH